MQRAKISIDRNQCTSLSKGVPQGLFLGTTFFNIFPNDVYSLYDIVEQCDIYKYDDVDTLSNEAFQHDPKMTQTESGTGLVKMPCKQT